jgi:hypothetical protein
MVGCALAKNSDEGFIRRHSDETDKWALFAMATPVGE